METTCYLFHCVELDARCFPEPFFASSHLVTEPFQVWLPNEKLDRSWGLTSVFSAILSGCLTASYRLYAFGILRYRSCTFSFPPPLTWLLQLPRFLTASQELKIVSTVHKQLCKSCDRPLPSQLPCKKPTRVIYGQVDLDSKHCTC